MTPLFNRTLALGVVAALATVAGPAGAAHAGTLQGDPRGGLEYVGAPGELNDVTIEWAGDELRLRDANAPIELRQRGVTAEASGDREVRIRPAVRITVTAGDGDDRVRVTGAPTDGASAVLGDGNDVLEGGPGRDFADGGLGDDRLLGGDGADVLTGGPGRDVLDGGPHDDALLAEGDFVADTLLGGEGRDAATVEPGEAVDASVESVTRAPFVPVLRAPDAPAPVRLPVTGRKVHLEVSAVPAAAVYGGTISLRVGAREIARVDWQDADAGEPTAVTARLGRLVARRVHRHGRISGAAVLSFDGLAGQLPVSEKVRLVSTPSGDAAVATASATTFATGGTLAGAARVAARVVAANEHAKVTRTANGALVAESLSTGRRTVLGRTVPTSLVDIDGHMVGYARAFSNRIEVRAIDARNGKLVRSSAAENVMALEVRRTGTLVWITEKDDERMVWARTFPTEVLLGTGKKIDPRSLAIADSDATTAHVFWVDGRQPHVAPVE